MSVSASGPRSAAVGTMYGGANFTGDFSILVQGGLGSLPTDYSGRIQNFLAEDLGAEQRPVSFGGREETMAALDAWLDGDRSPPYALVSAPAGRGKSALLAQWWSQRVSRRQDWAIVFVPVSIRFNTNLESVVFAAATARLAALHREKTPGDAHTSAQMWRALMTDYLRRPLPDGRRLLVVLDGLDEAAGWDAGADLFPPDPPWGLRAVVSARPRAGEVGATPWLRRLGWDRPGMALTLDLDLLTEKGVADALAQMGLPLDRLGGRVDIVHQIYRLSEGEPLLVRLYVDHLWSRREEAVRLAPEDLQKIPPGLEAYINRWWEEQRQLWGPYQPLREPQVRFLLKVFAFALGPLRQEDVLGLAPPALGLDSLLLDEAIRPLSRMVIGDGLEQGYVFSHPRLGVFFAEKWQADQDAMQDDFLKWGRQTIAALREGRLPPDKASHYVVQYDGAHLEGSSVDPDRLLELVCGGWAQAWEAVEGGFSGFLTDIERVWRAVTQRNQAQAAAGARPQLLAAEVLCALCKASINSLAGEIPPELLGSLIEHQIWTAARGFAHGRQVPNPLQRTRSLACVSRYLLEPLKSAAQAEALTAAEAIGNEYLRAEALAALVPNLSEPLLAEALESAGKFGEEKERSWVLGRLAAHLPEPLQKKSLAIARSIGNEYLRAETLAALAPHLSAPLLAEALELAAKFGEEKERVWVLGRLAAHLPKSLHWKSLAIARSIGNEYLRAEALAVLAPHLPMLPLAEAVEAARNFADEGERAWTLGAVGRHFSGAERTSVLAKAFVVARVISDEGRRAWALGELAPHLPAALMDEALDVAQKIQGAAERASALSSLAPHLQPVAREEALASALSAARTIGDAGARATALRTLAPHLPEALEAETWAELLVVPLTVTNQETLTKAQAILAPFVAAWGGRETLEAEADRLKPVDYCEILSKMSSHLPGPLLVQAFDVIRRTKHPGAWQRLLPMLGSALPESELRKTLADAFRTNSEQDSVSTLAALAPFLSGQLLVEALSAARRLEGADERTAALVSLVPRLAPPLRDEVIVEALNAAPGMRYQGKWKGVLSTLAPHLHGPLLGQALAVARGIKKADLQSGVTFDRILPWNADSWNNADLDERADGLAALAPYLPEPLLAEAIDAARAFEDGNQRAKALTALAPHLPRSLLAEALAATRSIGDIAYRARLLADLERELPRSVRSKELDAARGFLDEHRGPYILGELSDPRLQFAWEAHRVERIRNSVKRASAWTDLAPRLPASIWSQFWRNALAAARSNRSSGTRIRALGELSVHLPDPHGSEVWSEAMQAASKIRNESERTEILAALRRWEPGPLLAEELITARRTEDRFAKVSALAKIAPRLPEPQRVEILTDAFAAACAIEDPGKRVSAMIELSSGLTGLSLSALHDLWRQILPALARRSRPNLLTDIFASRGFLFPLGGPDIAAGIFCGVHAVGEWWP